MTHISNVLGGDHVVFEPLVWLFKAI